jgi:hypothetical protein
VNQQDDKKCNGRGDHQNKSCPSASGSGGVQNGSTFLAQVNPLLARSDHGMSDWVKERRSCKRVRKDVASDDFCMRHHLPALPALKQRAFNDPGDRDRGERQLFNRDGEGRCRLDRH